MRLLTDDFFDTACRIARAAAAGFRGDQLSPDITAEMDLDRLACNVRDRALTSGGLVTQLCVQVVRQFDSCSSHGMPAYH
jgi:hypothetical protein